MAKTLAELLAGEDMEGGESFCDSVYNFLKNKDRVQNIFTNSQVGVWSRSDTAQGLGVVKFDTGSVAAPAVGATVTGANGAKAKVVRMFVVSTTWGANTATGYVILGACGLNTNTTRFSDNEVLTYAGGTIAVNHPDATVLLSVTAATIAFNDLDPDTITDTGAGLGGFAAGDIIEISGSSSNNGFYWVAVAAAGTLTLHANESLTAEPLGATVTITRRGQGDWVRNGGFAANTGGWGTTDCAVASIGGGQIGNCLEITRTGGAWQRADQQMTGLIVGQIYKASVYVKSGTSGNEAFRLGIITADKVSSVASRDGTSGAAWVLYSVTFEATESNPWLALYKMSATAGTMLFDEASLYEINPCCTEGDALAFDTWYKDTTLDIYRQYYDGDTLTKNGMFYSLKCVPSAADDFLSFPNDSIRTRTEWYQQFIGETVSVGAWVKAWTADHARLSIDDGVTQTPSDYHAGDGEWEWLEITATIGDGATLFQVQFQFSAAPNLNGSTIVYISQDMLANVPYIGVGNYVPRQQEIVRLEVPIPSNALDGISNWSSVGPVALNIEADSDARLPKGLKGFDPFVGIRDSGSAANSTYFALHNLLAGNVLFYNITMGIANDGQHIESGGTVICDPSGDTFYEISASAANTLDIMQFKYTAVQVN